MQIERSTGTTESERLLAELADRTFLNLWSYPNLFIDKKKNGKGDGKELCDLLVICGNDIIIFSDKSISWPNSDDIILSWCRWYSRAVTKSIKQIRGAERWIDQYPDRIFLDKSCTQKFPLKLPPKETRKIHGVVVALGCGKACQTFRGGGSGSLMISPEVRGGDHTNRSAESFSPFTIGDLDPDGPFVHLLDDTTLKIILTELDTVTDFTSYLNKKEKFFRSDRLVFAHGEEDLLAHYLKWTNNQDEHDFIKENGSAWAPGDKVICDSGIYTSLLRNDQYLAKKEADRDSYVWDKLIETFTSHMLAGTTIVHSGEIFDVTEYEQAVRYMALVPRYQRRNFGRGILEVLELSGNQSRFVRAFLPGPTETNRDTGFFFMTLEIPDIELERGYEQYRDLRRKMLYGYALGFLQRNRSLKRVIGIGTEARSKKFSRYKGSSEDLIMVEMPKWTQDQLNELEEYKTTFDIMKEGRFKEYSVTEIEYPKTERKTKSFSDNRPTVYGKPKQNRKQRRAKAAKARKRKN